MHNFSLVNNFYFYYASSSVFTFVSRVSINIVGTLENQPKEVIAGTVKKILMTRLRGLSEREVNEIIVQLADEFLVSGNLSNTLDKIKKSKVKRNDWREELR